jgi:predicted transcriptional regulator
VARQKAKAHNDASKIKAEKRRIMALELRRQGLTHRVIAERLGVSEPLARQYVYDAFNELAKLKLDGAETLRAQELDKLDELEQRLHQALEKADDENTEGIARLTQQLTRIIERRAKLLGLDAPVKSQVEATVKMTTFSELLAEVDGDGE